MVNILESVKDILEEVLVGLDKDTIDYFSSLVFDGDSLNDEATIKETLVPFIESYGLVEDEQGAILKCDELIQKLKAIGITNNNNHFEEVHVLDKAINFNTTKLAFSETERAALDTMWGFDSIRNKRNEVIDSISDLEGVSARHERKLIKENKRLITADSDELTRLQSTFENDNDNIQISNMMLPDFSSGNNEKDIQVNSVSITFGGKLLLDNADLRLVYGRRYGLIGKNGIGKTTLLRHMAMFDIEGFPRHHRILHVKQVRSPLLIIQYIYILVYSIYYTVIHCYILSNTHILLHIYTYIYIYRK